MTSLCDRCQRPGACCTFALYGGPIGRETVTALEMLAMLASVGPSARNADGEQVVDPHFPIGLPFLPLYRQPDGFWRLWCPHLVRGRCSIYEGRPDLCRAYEAGSDGLCWHHDQETA